MVEIGYSQFRIELAQAGHGSVRFLPYGPFLNPNCPQNAKPGEYQCIPGTPVTVFEAWEKVTPFVLQDSAQFRPGPPYTVSEQRYTKDFNEGKGLGGDGSMTPSSRTADQTEIALFCMKARR
jgi:hypothetical protein